MDQPVFSRFVENCRVLYLIGITTLAYVCLKSIYNLYGYLTVYFRNAAVDYKSYGNWVLVTGATDGIGKCLAKELASKGLNIALVSRNPDKLRGVANEIEMEFGVETKCVTLDFTNGDVTVPDETALSVYDVIIDAIQDLDIGILVNNVGMTAGTPTEFMRTFGADNEPENLTKGIPSLINCNVLSQVKMTQLILPGMVKRRNGLIINFSSTAALFTLSYASLYSATKRFNDHFSWALSNEYEDQGIVIQSIQPGYVHTSLSASLMDLPKTILTPYPETYACHLLRSVGKRRMTHGYWMHAFQMWIATWVPTSFNMMGLKVLYGNKSHND